MYDALQQAALAFGFEEKVLRAARAALAELGNVWQRRDAQAALVSAKVVRGFHDAQLTDAHLCGTTGYGYQDAGRDAYERLLAQLLGAEAAFARLQLVSGTHAIVAAANALLETEGRLASLSGPPYDTLRLALVEPLAERSTRGAPRYREAAWGTDAMPDAYSVAAALRDQPDVVFIQRSRGYAPRPALSIAQIAHLIRQAKELAPAAVIVVDNCYGEFVEVQEPCDVGADLVAGSLIKNPGGGIAPGGAYLAGRTALVERVAEAVFAPGLGRKIGPSYDAQRWLFAGLHRAPKSVAESLKILDFAAGLFSELGYRVDPLPGAARADIIQAVALGSASALSAFTQGFQAMLPVNAFARPEPGRVPGYDDPVLMASGSFIGGSTMELSCDAPMRQPYEVYIQGGLDLPHGMLACMSAANRVTLV